MQNLQNQLEIVQDKYSKLEKRLVNLEKDYAQTNKNKIDENNEFKTHIMIINDQIHKLELKTNTIEEKTKQIGDLEITIAMINNKMSNSEMAILKQKDNLKIMEHEMNVLVNTE